ncbi:MAG: Hemerythrin HHE cation binding domain protein [Candidatus Micrarchaeum acidiphilum ARMAN-2]|uniref:Hemerythrin HHE cation binding domain protein n=1 Tax=Candidatus Micrarchaeum acidiphilum ARMAN-2 TaxID=425595 RepID=C7DHG8_MICA2|nr:MAG: Hemerythrin HHE cation binding domain protein [Candidatus Micrarchaeum acidiphilum ARMAN-2]
MNRVYEFMSGDHRRLDALLAEARALCGSGNAQDAASKFEAFRQGLLRHIGWEEYILFGMVYEELKDRDVLIIDELKLQHARIREDLEAIGAAPCNKASETLMNDLAAVLDAHDRMEEEGFYPWLDESLDESKIDAAMAAIKKSIEPRP